MGFFLGYALSLYGRDQDRLSHVLVSDLGLVPGNRVLLRGPNNLMMAASWLATVKAGLIAVPTMPLLRAKELGTIIGLARVDAVLCAASLRAEIELTAVSADEAAASSSAGLATGGNCVPPADGCTRRSARCRGHCGARSPGRTTRLRLVVGRRACRAAIAAGPAVARPAPPAFS